MWGDLYGVEWGEADSGTEFACQLVNDRIFGWHPTGGNFRKLMCGLSEIWGDLLEVIEELEHAYDLDDAVGVQLDVIGRKVGLARSGYSDDRYRDLLRIQVELVTTAGPDNERWAGTGESILTIVRRFVGPDADPIGLRATLPKDFILNVPGNLVVDEIDTLAFFLTKAAWSEVLGHMQFALDPDYYAWGSGTAGSAIPGEMVWDSGTAGAPIAGAGTWGTDILIGVE